MFVRMAPKSRLPVHRDPFAGSLRFHLGLRTPNSEKCRITVDGQTYWWKDGEGVLFDETFLHRAENETDEDRFILFCDVERPLRTRAARAFNHFIGDTLMRAFRTKNVQGEEVGALSRTFAALYPIRVLGKRIKQYNRPLYFTLKYAARRGGAIPDLLLALAGAAPSAARTDGARPISLSRVVSGYFFSLRSSTQNFVPDTSALAISPFLPN